MNIGAQRVVAFVITVDIVADQLLHYYLQAIGAGVTSTISYDYVNLGIFKAPTSVASPVSWRRGIAPCSASTMLRRLDMML